MNGNWWKVWKVREQDCVILFAETSDEALKKARKIDPSFSTTQVFEARFDVPRLGMK